MSNYFNASEMINIIKEREDIGVFLAGINEKNMLELLYSAGCKDALKIKPPRIEGYIRSKKPDLMAKLNNEKVACKAIILWSISLMNVEKKRSASYNDQNENGKEEKEISENGEEIRDDQIFPLLFPPYRHLSGLVKDDSVWKAYLIIVYIFHIEQIQTKIPKEYKDKFLQCFNMHDKSYVIKIKKIIGEILKSEIDMNKLQEMSDKLNEDFTECGNLLIETGQELIQERILPPYEIYRRIESLNSDIKVIMGFISKAIAFYEIKIEEKVKITNLNQITQMIEIIKESRKNGEKETKINELVWPLFEKALAINTAIDDEDEKEAIKNAREKIQIEWKMIHEDIDSTVNSELIDKVIKGNHPLNHLLNLLSNEQRRPDEKYKFSKLVSEHYGVSIANLALSGNLYIESDKETSEEQGISPANSQDNNTQSSSPDQVSGKADISLIPVAVKEDYPYSIESELGTVFCKKVDDDNNTSIEQSEDTPTGSNLGMESVEICKNTIIEASTVNNGEIEKLPLVNSIKENFITTERIEATSEEMTEPVQCIRADEINIPEKPIEKYQEKKKQNNLFNSGDTSQVIAQTIIETNQENNPNMISNLILHLVYEDRLCPAFHLANALQIKHPENNLLPWIIKDVSLSNHIRYPGGEIARILKADYEKDSHKFFIEGNEEWNYFASFLLASATLRPTLIDPDTGASSLLYSLRIKGLEKFYQYCQIFIKAAQKHQPLDIGSLKKVKDEAVWQGEMECLLSDLNNWQKKAFYFDMSFGRAKAIWRKWLEKGEFINNLLNRIQTADPSKLEDVRNRIKDLSDDKDLDRKIDLAEKEIPGFSVKIVAKAKKLLKEHIGEIRTFLCRWVNLMESSPRQQKSYLQTQAEELKKEIFSQYKELELELSEFERSHNSFLLHVGVECLKRSLSGINALFAPDSLLPLNEPLTKHIINFELLKIPELILDENWSPEKINNGVLIKNLLQFLSKKEIPWKEAIEEQCKARNHEAAERIVEYVSHNDVTNQNNNSMELDEIRERNLAECRNSLQRDLDLTDRYIDNAVAFGLLRESERNAYSSEVQKIRNHKNEIRRFFRNHDKLKEIRSNIDEKRKQELEKVKKRLSKSGIPIDSIKYGIIIKAINDEDVLAANEYIDMAARGLELPVKADTKDKFTDFFDFNKFRHISDLIMTEDPNKRIPVNVIIRDIENGRNFGSIIMKNVPGTAAKNASWMVKNWFQAKTQKKISEDQLKDILNHLGFNAISAKPNKDPNKVLFDVTTDVLRDKNQCPVPRYGSATGGRYKILCVWDRPSEDDLLSDVGETPPVDPAVIVFHFGVMTEKKRRDLARRCRERGRTLIVIDDIVILYLCGERGSRLPVLFDITLPFTHIEPYMTTAGYVAPEMFYGRQSERNSIIDPGGSCFLYGGRQLGKTALLRDVEKTYHNSVEGIIVKWIDLKGEGIGYDRKMEDFWAILLKTFKDLQVIPENIPNYAVSEKVLKSIEEWLKNSSKRRIILLLDEADKFFEIDGDNEYINVTRLFALMDKTGHRFKTVFAGLHNVLRTSNQVNDKLPHLGQPICIGPLLDNGEWKEAEALVKRPLESLGFRFEKPELITRILSQTNYYPSLIQLYCRQLLRHLTNTKITIFDQKNSPPYVITSNHVEEAYKSQELRRDIRDRFMWTLNLDPRYRVIAFSMALEILSGDSENSEDSFHLRKIRNDVMTWWSKGFSESDSEDEVESLLEEMVGLGILRLSGRKCYSFRSPNVITLLGTIDEIETELEKSENKESPIEYKPDSFRSVYRYKGEVTHWRRNPLTAMQESELKNTDNKITVIFGNNLSGLGEVEKFLKTGYEDDSFIYLDGIIGEREFIRKIPRTLKKENWHSIMLVSNNCPWKLSWITEALDKVKDTESRTSSFRIGFLADPERTWQLLNESNFNSIMDEPGISKILLKPWQDPAVRQWIDDCGVPVGVLLDRKTIVDVTGNWHEMFYNLYEFLQRTHDWNEALRQLKTKLETPGDSRNILNTIGLDDNIRRKILKTLHDLGEPLSVEDLASFLSDISLETIQCTIQWADLLNLIKLKQNEKWTVSPFIGFLLDTAEGE